MEKLDYLIFVDDDPFTNRFHEIILKRSGITSDFTFFQYPQKGLNHMKELLQDRQSLPDYLFLDLNMPDLDGWQFLDELQKEDGSENLSVIILTTSLDRQDAERANAYPMVKSFNIKPLTVDFLQSLIPVSKG